MCAFRQTMKNVSIHKCGQSWLRTSFPPCCGVAKRLGPVPTLTGVTPLLLLPTPPLPLPPPPPLASIPVDHSMTPVLAVELPTASGVAPGVAGMVLVAPAPPEVTFVAPASAPAMGNSSVLPLLPPLPPLPPPLPPYRLCEIRPLPRLLLVAPSSATGFGVAGGRLKVMSPR